MTYAQKLALAAELRAGTGLDAGLPPESRASVRELHEPTYLPGGFEKTKVPLAPPDISEDLSHLNPKWKKRRKAG